MNDDHTEQNRQLVQEAFERSLETGSSFDLEVDLVDGFGRCRRVRTSGQAERQSEEIVRVSNALVFGRFDSPTWLQRFPAGTHLMAPSLSCSVMG